VAASCVGKVKFFAAMFLSILFTLALLYLTLEVPNMVNAWLLRVFPDYWIVADESIAAALEVLRVVGFISFIITVALIMLGFLFNKMWLSRLGLLAFYLPTFGYFAFTMFFLAGIGVLRVLWLPLLQLSPNVLRLGEIVYLPSILFGFSTVPASCTIIFLGLLVFMFGVLTWLYSKFKGVEIVDFWIYKYSRHPQYLGFLMWSYGLMLLASAFGAPRASYTPPPSFPWLISAFTTIGIALHEEQMMVKSYGDKYKKYMEGRPFMLPLPRKLTAIIVSPAKIVIKKVWPENGIQILITLFIYLCALILLSLPLQYFTKL